MLRCPLVARQENLTGVSTGLTGQSKNLDPIGASRPGRFPSLFRAFPSYLYRIHIYIRQLILMQMFFVIVKRYCSKSVLLKKWEQLEIIKRSLKLFPRFQILLIWENTFQSVWLLTISNPTIRNFVTSQKAYSVRSVHGSLDLQVSATVASFQIWW